MGCSSSVPSSSVVQPQTTTSTSLLTKSSTAEPKSLSDACRFGDVDRVNDLLQTATLYDINKADLKTGDTPLHLATRHGWLEIVRLLLSYGAARHVLNHAKKNPVDGATDVEMKKLFNRSTNSVSNRFVWDNSQEKDQEEIEWSQSAIDALEFCVKYDCGLSYVGSWNIGKTVDTIKKASELSTDTSSNMKQVWDFLDKARETNNATHLVRAYTVESNFFRILNQKLAHRRLEKSEYEDEDKRLLALTTSCLEVANHGIDMAQAAISGTFQTDHAHTTDWVHLYLGTIYMSLLQLGLQFTGCTYRGMWVNERDLDHFKEEKLCICNKAITSTSTSFKVAKHFISGAPPSAGLVPVICMYTIDSITMFKAFSVRTISEYPDEEEVIIFPGIPFEIVKVERDTASNMVTVKLASILSDQGKM